MLQVLKAYFSKERAADQRNSSSDIKEEYWTQLHANIFLIDEDELFVKLRF